MGSGRRIGRALARLFMATRRDGDRPVAEPGCEYGLMVDERLKAMAQSLEEMKTILRWLFFLVIGTCIVLVLDVALAGLRVQ